MGRAYKSSLQTKKHIYNADDSATVLVCEFKRPVKAQRKRRFYWPFCTLWPSHEWIVHRPFERLITRLRGGGWWFKSIRPHHFSENQAPEMLLALAERNP